MSTTKHVLGRSLSGAVVAFALLGSASPGWANDPIPLPQSIVDVGVGNGLGKDQVGTTSLYASIQTTGINQFGFVYVDEAEASVFDAPDPTLAASVSGLGWAGVQGAPGALASLDYSAYVEAPADDIDQAAPLDLSYKITSNFSFGNDFTVQAEIGVETDLKQYYSDVCGTGGVAPTCSASQLGSTTYVGTGVVTTLPETRIYITMVDSIDFNYLGIALPYSGAVEIDPTLVIDPAFLSDHPGYSLEFSASIGDTPPSGVPEPAAWALMLIGIGAAGAAVRGSRRQRAIA
jgi:hypothetical protein